MPPGSLLSILTLSNLAHLNDTSTECFSATTTSVHQDLWKVSFLKEDIHLIHTNFHVSMQCCHPFPLVLFGRLDLPWTPQFVPQTTIPWTSRPNSRCFHCHFYNGQSVRLLFQICGILHLCPLTPDPSGEL